MPIKIGDKEYSEEEATKLITEHETMAKTLEELKPIRETIQEYGVSAEQYRDQSKGAFGALLKLQETGVLDEEGNVIPQTPKPASASETLPGAPPGTPPREGNAIPTSVDDIAKKALEAISPKIKKLEDENEMLRSSVNRIYREKITDTVRAKGLDVSDEDISLSFVEATRSGKDFWDVLGERAKRNTSVKDEAVKEFAKKHNLDIGELNKLAEIASSDGNVAASIVEGKSLSLKPAKGGLSPLDATRQLFKAKG